MSACITLFGIWAKVWHTGLLVNIYISYFLFKNENNSNMLKIHLRYIIIFLIGIYSIILFYTEKYL